MGGPQSPSASDSPQAVAAARPWLELGAFEGPLDLLYDLARDQKVDLANVSILSLVEQYLAFMEHARQIRIELEADWLVMAAWLTWLKSKLLLPQQEEVTEEVQDASTLLHSRLAELEKIRNAAAWLASQPILDEVVFARGQPEDLTRVDRSGLTADLAGLISAYLNFSRRRHRKKTYTPAPIRFWTIGEAMAALQRMLNRARPGQWCALEELLEVRHNETVFEHKAAFAGALSACLEMAKAGALSLEQSSPFAPILFGATGLKRL